MSSATWEDTSEDDFDRIVSVNFKGVFLALKSVLPFMRKQGRGAIVTVGSEQSLVGKPKSAVYAATKGAVLQLSRATALDYASSGIRVNCVCPGITDTASFRAGVAEYARRYARDNRRLMTSVAIGSVPLKTVGDPRDVAALIAFLCSDQGRFITGAAYAVDGGYTAQ